VSTKYTFLRDDTLLQTMGENAQTLLLNNVLVQLSDSTAYSPAGTTSTTLVMAGYGQTFTPSKTGRVLIILLANVNNNTAGDGVQAVLSYGSGTPPAANSALTGTQVGGTAKETSAAASASNEVALAAVVSGLTVGTTYWLDVAYSAITGGTATISIIYAVVIEF
jgi:hypothetical protein